MSRLSDFIKAPAAKKLIVFEALYYLCRSWILVRFFEFRRWKGRLGTSSTGEVFASHTKPPSEVHSVRRAINQLNQIFGGSFTCLMVAMAAKEMLRRRGIASSLVLGVNTGEVEQKSAMRAHAWLYVGQVVLLGDEERKNYKAVASYIS